MNDWQLYEPKDMVTWSLQSTLTKSENEKNKTKSGRNTRKIDVAHLA